MILNQSQAKAVYDAMCALNNVNGKAIMTFDKIDVLNFTNVFERPNGNIRVCIVKHGNMYRNEDYPNQAGFAEAYGVA